MASNLLYKLSEICELIDSNQEIVAFRINNISETKLDYNGAKTYYPFSTIHKFISVFMSDNKILCLFDSVDDGNKIKTIYKKGNESPFFFTSNSDESFFKFSIYCNIEKMIKSLRNYFIELKPYNFYVYNNRSPLGFIEYDRILDSDCLSNTGKISKDLYKRSSVPESISSEKLKLQTSCLHTIGERLNDSEVRDTNVISYWEGIIKKIRSMEKLTADLEDELIMVENAYAEAINKITAKKEALEEASNNERKKREEAALDERKKNIQEAKINKGKIGEKEVIYALKWLDKTYKLINDGNHVIIKNIDFIDESQEIDHLVVGPQGIFIIETKYFSGNIIIDSKGNWIREKKNGSEGVTNPLQQVRRHEKIVKSIVGDDVPIYPIMVLANTKTIITGSENSKVPITKVDMLEFYISSIKSRKIMDEKQINALVKKINKYICNT